MSINFQAFLKLDTSKYLDQYIVMIDKKVVANGKDIVSMLKSVQKKYPHKTPFIAKIPEKNLQVLRAKKKPRVLRSILSGLQLHVRDIQQAKHSLFKNYCSHS